MPGPPEYPVLGGVEHKKGAVQPAHSAGTGVTPVTGVNVPFLGSNTHVYVPTLTLTGLPITVSVPGTYSWIAPAGVTEIYGAVTGGGGGGGSGGGNTGKGGGGGGAYAERGSIPVTPGNTYTIVVGAAGTLGGDGGDSWFIGDSAVEVLAKGGKGALNTSSTAGAAGGLASGSIGEFKYSGGSGGSAFGGPGDHGAGGGAAASPLGAGASVVGTGNQTGAVGVDGAGSGGNGGNYDTGNATAGGVPGGGGGGGGGFVDGAAGGGGQVFLTAALVVHFRPSATVVFPIQELDGSAAVSQEAVEAVVTSSGPSTGSLVTQEAVEAVVQSTATTVNAALSQAVVEVLVSQPHSKLQQARARIQRTLSKAQTSIARIGHPQRTQTATARVQKTRTRTQTATAHITPFGELDVPFLPSHTVVYAPSITEVTVPFLPSHTHVWPIFTLFNPNATYSGPGNGGEGTVVRLAPAGGGVTAALAGGIGTSDGGTLSLTGDAGMPTDRNFVITVDSEQILVFPSPVGGGVYYIRGRALGNTTAASHSDGAPAVWGDSYDMAIVAGTAIAHNFTAVIADQPSYTYPGWLICFDSSQAYNAAGARYPMHVTQVMGVFAAGAGVSGLNKCDAAQPNAVHTPTGISDHCPSAMSNPSRISDNINVGDVAVVRYTNPESYVLDLGPRSGALQSWFGFMRVDATNHDVTFTHTDGYIVDSLTAGTYGPGPYTGSVNGVWDDPVPLVTGIAPDASDAAGHAVPTPTPVPWTTVTLPGSDRFFTYGPPGYSRQGWPICALAVRQGNRRVPHWESWDWRDYNYVYNGFGTDDTFVQMLINRNGVVFSSVPEVELPGPQDIDGPDAVWDDGTYYFAASWYVVLFNGPYIVFGPAIGGTPSGGAGGGGGYVPGVGFGPGPTPGPPIVTVPPIEGGSGGGIDGVPSTGLHGWSIF